MGFAFEAVQHAQVALQLSEVGGLELPGLQLDRHEAVQFAVEEEEVDVLVFAEGVQMVLVADEGEVLAEGEYEVLDVVDDGVFHDPLVDIPAIPGAEFLDVDEVEQVFVLEGPDGAEGLGGGGQGAGEIVRQGPLVAAVAAGDAGFEVFPRVFLFGALLDVENPLLHVLDF